MTKTRIEWTDDVWNPVTGCTKVSPGCDNCYAERITERFHGKGSFEEIVLHEDRIEQPLRWRKPRRVFVNSMSDLFHAEVPREFIARVFAVMRQTPQHTYQILTKRPGRMRAVLADESFPAEVARAADRIEVRREIERMGEERWRPVKGFYGYYVSDRGNVASERRGERRPMRPQPGDQGHSRVELYRGDGTTARRLVHHMVLEAFVCSARDGEQTCHRDGDATNNALPNLRWGTQSDNWVDRQRHGNQRSYSKLTLQQVEDVRAWRRAGRSKEAVAREFGISATQVTHIECGEQWAERADWPLPQVWLGVSVEDQERADKRIPVLLDTPVAVRFLSCEPLLGPISLTEAYGYGWERVIHWVIVGGESGLKARPMDPEWARAIRDECVTAGVPFFFKQWGGRTPKANGRELDGRTWDEYPPNARADCGECDWWVEADTDAEAEKELRRHFRMCHRAADPQSGDSDG